MANSSNPSGKGEYIVVARRYRPQGFDDLVGQRMVSQALRNAISTDRVGHAYLFTGARGVGKTSTARILSKALNCVRGPTETPCHECDICQSIASGDDVDVLEIDGASNRGIDEIRQLRSNVSVRPSRSRFKIYIIDEVHMLTKEAFNALLKTLEEPPEHVKFIFCTTDPEKIPITVLSRCQRFDFSPVETAAIVDRLKYIVAEEGAEADDEALKLLARRAAGSMRDSQSLLEQLLSFTSEKITVQAVHGMLGTAGTARLHGVLTALATHDAATALSELDQAVHEGVDAGQLAEQLLGGLRDLLALSVGGGKELMLHISESEVDELTKLANSWGTANLLAAAQILDQAIARMRMVTHSRILLETSLVRIARLEDLQQLATLIADLRSGELPTAAKKKTVPLAAVSVTEPRNNAGQRNSADDSAAAERPSPAKLGDPAQVGEAASPTAQKAVAVPHHEAPAAGGPAAKEQSAEDLWRATISRLEGIAADCASDFASAASFAPNRVVVTFPDRYNSSKSFCQKPDRHGEMEKIISEVAGMKLKLEFALREDEAHPPSLAPTVSPQQRLRDVMLDPFVQRAMELFSADVVGDDGR